MQTITLQVPVRLEFRELVTSTMRFACKIALGHANSEHRSAIADELVSAVGEAFNNVVLHGDRSNGQGSVSIAVEFDAERIGMELTDDGTSFDPQTVAAPDLGCLPESGLGLYIIRSFVDKFEYSPGPPNVLRLTKFLPVH